jgi:uncharacterized XkdX family phage protein
MWYSTIKRYYDSKHPAYTNEGVKIFVQAEMITADQYTEITGVSYAA